MNDQNYNTQHDPSKSECLQVLDSLLAYFGGQAVFCGCLSGEFVSTFNCGTFVMMHLMGY